MEAHEQFKEDAKPVFNKGYLLNMTAEQRSALSQMAARDDTTVREWLFKAIHHYGAHQARKRARSS